MEGISNEDIVSFFEEKNNDDLKKNFVDVFPSNYIVKLISFHRMMAERRSRYPFIIMSTGCSNKSSTHWWSFLDLHPKKEIFLFDSFGFEGFKEFIIQDDKKLLNKILFGIDNLKKKQYRIIKNFSTKFCLV